MNKDKCRHCRSTKRTIQARRLCSRCYLMPEVRERYGKIKTLPPPPRPEPTAAELEAMIAEQMKCLPPWWNEDAAGVEGLKKVRQPRPDSRGKDRKHAKLTAEIVQQIRHRARKGERCAGIARDLGITRANVSLIVNRKSWRDVA